MVNVNFSNLVSWFVNNKMTVDQALDMVTVVYWENLPALEQELKQYEIFNFNCEYEVFGEKMLHEFNKRFLNK